MTDNLERLRVRDEHLAQWAACEIERLREIEKAARNLVTQKGRHHTQQAYERLAALVVPSLKNMPTCTNSQTADAEPNARNEGPELATVPLD